MNVDTPQKQNVLNQDRAGLEKLFLAMGEKAFRSTQVMKWIYHEGLSDFNDMTNLSKALRARLAQAYQVRLPELVTEQPSRDGTYKWLLRLESGNCIETVFIPEANRGTLCISSQVGCTLNCSFCSTAKQGFNHNLSVAEIIGQVVFASRRLGIPENRGDRVITNIVFMGMGEPLLNFENVIQAINIMTDDFGFGISKRRVTLSTAGMVPAIDKLRAVTDVSLAVSLHAPTNELRDQLVPLNRKYPIEPLLAACQRYIAGKLRRKITFEYVMIDGVNDHVHHAQQLAELLKDFPAKINLIPFNPYPGTRYRRSSNKAVDKFRNIITESGLTTITRKTRGDDIDAACGQLVGRVQDRTRRQSKWQIAVEKKQEGFA